MSRVAVFGPVSWNLLVRVAALPEPRPQMVTSSWHNETVGGTSAGKALNLRRLGIDVSLVTCIGDDEHGRKVAGVLEDAGVALTAVPSRTGTERHVNLMDDSGRRLSIYIVQPEAAAPVPLDAIETADAVVVDLAEYSRPALAAAQAAGIPVWCDLHDYDGVSAWHQDFLDAADHLFLSVDGLADVEAFLRQQVGAGKRTVVCTAGPGGAYGLAAGGEVVHVPAEPVDEVVDTNGAGDAFVAGFLAAELTGASFEECLRRGATAGAECVRRPTL